MSGYSVRPDARKPLRVRRCDGILRLPGESPGADREQSHAERLGLPWHYGDADDTTDLFTLFIEQVHARAAQR